MSDYCQDTLCCRPEDLTRAMPIHTKKITDSCRDKDCIEDLRVYMTRESQNVLDSCGNAKVRAAELICTNIDVSPVAYNRNHYCIDLTFYYRIIADATVNACKPACLCGLAMFSKRAVLCGENSGVHVFSSDEACGCCNASLPTAVVEVTDTNSLCTTPTYIHRKPAAAAVAAGFCYGIVGLLPRQRYCLRMILLNAPSNEICVREQALAKYRGSKPGTVSGTVTENDSFSICKKQSHGLLRGPLCFFCNVSLFSRFF